MPLVAFLLFLLISLHCSPQVASTGLSFSKSVLSQGSSLLVEKNDHLVSSNQIFTAGFHQVGKNAYCFAIWFSEPMSDDKPEIIWMANRDEPVNGKRSRFSLRKTGNLVLTDVGRISWSTDTRSNLPVQLQLLDSVNNRRWIVSWQATSTTCSIHGICGPNSLCSYSTKSGRRCNCMHGYKAKNHSDLSFGCEPTFSFSGDQEQYGFITLPRAEFYGFDSAYRPRSSLQGCKNACLNDSNFKAFQFTFDKSKSSFNCYLKTLLFNGYQGGTRYYIYLKLPKKDVLSYTRKVANMSKLDCSISVIELKRVYGKKSEHSSLKFMLWFSIILGVIEVLCFLFFYFITRKPSSTPIQNYLAIATGFKRFTHDEIVKASSNFRDEIGRGGGGIVYKGTLPDNRVVAIKQLHEAIQGEAEFLAEMSTIGRINHRNLIETYGCCAKGKHRILVYEYMENGSLATNLGANQLGWKKKYEIAVGVAKGLAYLHEECLEWVLHCDVKPHNILLDADYNPKVADFGLSKLFHQDLTGNSIFSKIRGTRGYMAPEWVFNLPITSKVDVYSYGMVLLEMITGRSPTCDQVRVDNERVEQTRLVSWVREKVNKAPKGLTKTELVEKLDPMMNDEYEEGEMKNVLKVALQCVMEDKDARPSMGEIVNMLLHPEMEMDD